jgi:hypothetical protein
MNITMFPRIAQVAASWLLLAAAALGMACSTGGSSAPAPANPEATVFSFLSAVSAQDMTRMAELWGSSSGPAANRMDAQTLEQRLTVIRVYLEHEEYAVVPRPTNVRVVETEAGERVVYVRLTRRGCTPVVPFTLVQYANGWLIRNIDLQAAGNPARRCRP